MICSEPHRQLTEFAFTKEHTDESRKHTKFRKNGVN